MKLKKEFLVHGTGNECIVVPTAAANFSGVLKGNETSGMIFHALQSETSEDALISMLSDEYDAPSDVIKENVQNVLSALREIGALDE